MQTVNIADLKNNLSLYLRQVRQGNEIMIKDRNRVIARIVPTVPSENYEQELVELAVQGKVKLPEHPLDEASFYELLNIKLPRMKSKGVKAKELMSRIWEQERGEY